MRLLKFLFIIMIGLLLTGQMTLMADSTDSAKEENKKWDTTEKVLYGLYLTASAADFYQASQAKRLGFQESNPLFRNKDGSPNLALAAVAKIMSATVVGIGANMLPHKARKVVLIIVSATQIGVVIYNEKVTGGIIFRYSYSW